jgi:hypothetical protein
MQKQLHKSVGIHLFKHFWISYFHVGLMKKMGQGKGDERVPPEERWISRRP